MTKKSTPGNPWGYGLPFFLLFSMLILSINAKSSPTAYFSSAPRSGCAPLLVHFYNASATGTYSWNFGDPGSGAYDTSTACGPFHIFNTPGNFVVTLTVVTGSGTFTHNDTITVLPSPAPNITGIYGTCEGTTTAYTVPYNTGSTYSWVVNGGNYSTNTNGNVINVTWLSTGFGDITVTETNSAGCSGTDTFNVYVAPLPHPENYLPCGKGGSNGGNDPKRKCICEHSVATYTMPNNGDTYTWYVTNGIFLPPGNTGNSVQVQWGSAGLASISVVEISPYGCRDSASCILSLCPGPHASFTANNACLGSPTSFNNSASVGNSTIVSYAWDFGDGNTTTGSSPSHTYAGPGYYNVTLTVTNENGCTDDTVISVYVDPGNGPQILCPGTVCAHSQATYYTLYIPGATYTWTVTGGTGTPNANGDSIHVVWGAGTVGTITLVVTGTTYYTCVQPVTVNVPIFPTSPSILGPVVVCPGSTTTYTAPLIPGSFYNWTVTGGDTSYSVSGNVLTVTWDHTSNPGTITLIMKNSLVCCIGGDTIYVNKKPELFIQGQQVVCAGASVTYNLPAGVLGNWVVNGGNINTSFTNVNSINVTWGSAGAGIITATPSVSGVYCNAVALYNINIVAPPLPANINGPKLVCLGSSHTYTANIQPGVVSSSWSVSPSNIINYQTSDTAIVTWNTAGPATLTVTQTNGAGCPTVTTYSVYVVPATLPAINGPLTACVHDVKTYTISSSAPPGVYDWTVVGGNVVSGYGTDTLMVQWGFSSGGTVTINNLVCGTSASIHVNIFDTPSIHIDTSGLTCTGSSIILTATPGLTNYLWSNSATTQSITVSSPGTYTVTANTPGSSCSGSASITLTSIPSLPNPVASITVTPMAAPPSLSPLWQLSASPSGAGNAWLWSNSATTQSIFVNSTGTYSVTVTNQYGCSSSASATIPVDTSTGSGGSGCSISSSNPCPTSGTVTLTAGAGSGWVWSNSATSQSITVGAGTYTVTYTNALGNVVSCSYTVIYAPTPSFTLPSPVCNPVVFTNTTSPSATTYLWDFGDGSFSNAVNGVHNYLATGTYTVILYATNDGICWTSVSHTVTVNVILNAGFTFSSGCSATISFTDTSVIQTYTTVGYAWNFGDPGSGASDTSNSTNPTHTFSVSGPHTVTLTITSGGCSSTISQTVVSPELIALFSHCSLACLGQSTQFLDLSIHTSQIVSWVWTFGNGDTSTLQNPWNVYTTAGTYTISLTVTDIHGCTSSQSLNVTVSPFSPGSLTIVGDTVLCAGDSVLLSAPAGYSYIWSNGATTQSIYAHISGDYSVTVINNNGCTHILGPVHVITHPRPTATITLSGSSTMCEYSTLTLQAPVGTGYTYNWYHDNVLLPWYNFSSSISLYSQPDSGVYTVVVINAFGCKDSSAPVTIHVNPSPLIGINGSVPICHSQSITLSVTNYTPTTIVSYLWSNTSTASTITVSQAGTYSVTVTGSNGCTSSATTAVTMAPLPNFGLLPTGCYTICKGYTAVVPGPAGPFTYQWYNGNTPAGTTQNLTITGPGTYWLVIQDSYGCSDTSQKFTVSVVSPPVAVISSSGAPILCNTGSGSIILTANSGEGYQYLWSNGETSQSITVTAPGTYYVTVKINNCCESTDSITIEGMNCCFPAGTPFTTIPDGDTVSTDQVWAGKYFIAGKVHVINHAILDLTEVDLVFDSTGEIIFHDTTIVRANNSVLRPCDMNKTWVGVTFKDYSRGIVHTTLFKNAEIALNVISKDTCSVKSVDNSFVQCHVGIYINKNGKNYVEGITGNSFVIDNTYLPFVTNDYFGIELDNTVMKEIISQNSFRNASKEAQYKNYFGIFATQSSAMVSANVFTNMHRSLDVLDPVKYFSIENNTMEITQSRTPNDYQIRVEKNNVPHLIYNNEIRNSLPSLSTGTAAIFVNGSSLMNIKENHIKGFEYGIEMLSSNTSQIIENVIQNAQTVGIYYNDGIKKVNDNVDIACNEVNMDLQPGQTSLLPVGIATINADGSTQIRTNCVSNSCHAILVFSIYGETIPLIRNNFMYNYTFAGIRNSGHVGNIGISSAVFANAGRNTFVRNNYTSTDIFSVPAIIESGNYGVQQVSGLVNSIGAPDKFNSTAACGLQIQYPKKVQLDDIAICDHFIKYLYPFLKENGSEKEKHDLSLDKQEIAKDPANQTLERLTGVLQTIARPDNLADANAFYEFVTSSGYLKGNDASWFDYKYAVLMQDYQKAGKVLSSIIPLTKDESDHQLVEQVRLNLVFAQSDMKKLDNSDKSTLAAIDTKRGIFAATARDMLQMSTGDHDYIFTPAFLPDLDMTIPKDLLNKSEEMLEVYPNPVHSLLNIRYNFYYEGNQDLKLVDVTGRELTDVPLTYNSMEMQLDVKNIPPGVYLIYLTQGEKVHRIKFVKY